MDNMDTNDSNTSSNNVKSIRSKRNAKDMIPSSTKSSGSDSDTDSLTENNQEFELELKTGPRKKYYRQRAHSQVLIDINLGYPNTPSDVDWSLFYPNIKKAPLVPTVIDLGCGYGGLLFPLSHLLPDAVILGIEIRRQTSDFVRHKIHAARIEYPGQYQNISIMRSNAMKTWPNTFHKNSIEKLFICFPDPQFKKANIRKRIVSTSLLDQYAYSMKPGAIFYSITDVRDVTNWIQRHTDAHPCFERLPDSETETDPSVTAMLVNTEEGKKVARENRPKYVACWRVVK